MSMASAQAACCRPLCRVDARPHLSTVTVLPRSTGGFKEYWDAFRELPGVQVSGVLQLQTVCIMRPTQDLLYLLSDTSRWRVQGGFIWCV